MKKSRQKTTFERLREFTSPYKKYYIASIVFAVIGVIFSILPYFAVSRIVIGLINENRDFGMYMRFCGLLAGMWTLRFLFHMVSTTVSHKATFAVIADIRKRIAKKLARLPMGYVIDTPSGKLKNIMVEKIDSIEPTLAHVVPEMWGRCSY